jgi:glycosyltransferase involved in cell wall biosynthesis
LLSQSRGIGAYSKNLLLELKKTPDLQISEIGSFSEVKSDLDLVHVPFFDLFFHTLPLSKKKPTVVTIHDVIPLIFSQHYPSGLKGKLRFHLQKQALKNVAAILTDSECSKKDIAKYLGVPLEKIHVTYLAPSDDFKTLHDRSFLDDIKGRYKLPNIFWVLCQQRI